jgi:hypothetical protein
MRQQFINVTVHVTGYLGDATMATIILDHLIHRCAMLEFEGKSYRLKEAAERIASSTETS